MILSNIIGSGAKPYLEYGWVTAPNTGGQSITANTITTLTIDTEIADTGNYGSIASNQITLAAGTYYYDAYTPCSAIGGYGAGTIGLFNVTSSNYISRGVSYNLNGSGTLSVRGQFNIAAATIFELRVCSGGSYPFYISNQGAYALSSITTAGADQRTTIKLWKLA